MPPEQNTMPAEPKSSGALIGSIVIIVILIIGGIYLWKTTSTRSPAPEGGEPLDSVGASLSDETDLEADVNSIDLENLDEGI